MVSICPMCKQEKECPMLIEMYDNDSKPVLVRCCVECRAEAQAEVDKLNARASS